MDEVPEESNGVGNLCQQVNEVLQVDPGFISFMFTVEKQLDPDLNDPVSVASYNYDLVSLPFSTISRQNSSSSEYLC